MQSTFSNNFGTAGACGIAFSVIMVCGLALVCILMEGIKKKRHLEDIRKLHKKIREAKESESMDPRSVSEVAVNVGGRRPGRPGQGMGSINQAAPDTEAVEADGEGETEEQADTQQPEQEEEAQQDDS